MFGEGGPDLQSLLQQAAQMQERLESAHQELEDARVEGSAGGGLVQATVTGTGELVALRIDPQACDPTDTETLADLIVAAVRNAADNASDQAADAMGDVTGGLESALGSGLPGLPGLSGLSGLTGGSDVPAADADEPDDDRP